MTQAQFEQHLTDAINKRFATSSMQFSKRDVQAIMDVLAEEAGKLLKKGEDVRLRGLATVKLAKRPAQKSRMGRNPATGEAMKIKAKPASKRVRVLPHRDLKARAGAK